MWDEMGVGVIQYPTQNQFLYMNPSPVTMGTV